MSWLARAARARVLAERYAASREVLEFYAALAEWLASGPSDVAAGLADLVERAGPEGLKRAGRSLEWGPWNFFGRVCRMASAGPAAACGGCDGPPQAGCLVPRAEGSALELVCALCLGRRPFPRGKCPGCGDERLEYYSAAGFEHLQVQACEACRAYLLVVDLGQEPEAIPEVDELAGLPLDLWAQGQGYRKLVPNLAGV